MKNVKIRHWLLAVLLMALAQSVSANSIDKVYTKSVSQTWGEWFKSIFQKSDFNKSYAIVIGVSRFDDFQNLGTAQDPIRMKDYLLNEAGFDYVRLITGDQVNLNKIRSIMQDEMPRTLKANDRFLFYWSGHGATDSGNGSQFGYLPVANSRQNAFSTMLSMNDLSQWDKKLSVKQSFYLLDACFSGLAGFQVQNDSRAQTLQQIARPSRQILTAGSANEETIVINRLGGSVFTKAVIDGLRGAADAEFRGLGRDGIVSARELSLYVQRSVAREATQAGWHKPITPLLWNANSRSVGDFFFFTDKTVAPVIAAQPRPREAGVTVQSGNAAVPRSAPKPASSGAAIEPEMVTIPAGTFTMGCVESRDVIAGMDKDKCHDSEKPVHEVSIRAFQMGKYEVTFDEWSRCTQAGVCIRANDEGWGRGQLPVINVNWNDAQVYIRWLNQQTGKHYRLPTEAEWEYAARAGGNTAFPWGNSISCRNADYWSGNASCHGRGTSLVGHFAPNRFGLHDTVGNVEEWTQDCWSASYQGAAPDGAARQGCGATANRVVRGGSWGIYGGSVNSAFRYYHSPDFRFNRIGFRLALGH